MTAKELAIALISAEWGDDTEINVMVESENRAINELISDQSGLVLIIED